jgi:uncharacterized protein YjiS (DUF1127 family)
MQRDGTSRRSANNKARLKEDIIMSTISSISAQSETDGGLAQLLLRTAKRWWLAYVAWRVEQLTIARLRSMSDRQLKDIGVARFEIEFAVRNGTERDRILSSCF